MPNTHSHSTRPRRAATAVHKNLLQLKCVCSTKAFVLVLVYCFGTEIWLEHPRQLNLVRTFAVHACATVLATTAPSSRAMLVSPPCTRSPPKRFLSRTSWCGQSACFCFKWSPEAELAPWVLTRRRGKYRPSAEDCSRSSTANAIHPHDTMLARHR